jgi:hypothetical protein
VGKVASTTAATRAESPTAEDDDWRLDDRVQLGHRVEREARGPGDVVIILTAGELGDRGPKRFRLPKRVQVFLLRGKK